MEFRCVINYLVCITLMAPSLLAARQAGGTEYRSGTVTMWIPDDADTIHGVWWITNEGGPEPAYIDRLDEEYLQWNPDPNRHPDTASAGNRPYAASMNLAMAHDESQDGSGTDIFVVLEDFAATTNHPELAYACLIPMGISNTGSFATRMLDNHPGRCITAVPSHFTYDISGNDEALEVPRLDVVAQDDYLSETQPGVDNLPFVLQGRARNAPWCGFVTAGDGHNYWTWSELKIIQMWIRFVMPMRMPEEIPLDTVPELRPVTVPHDSCWFGSFSYSKWPIVITDAAISRYKDFQGDLSTAFWMPNQEFARTWMIYMGFDPGPISARYHIIPFASESNACAGSCMPSLFTATGRSFGWIQSAGQVNFAKGIYISIDESGTRRLNTVRPAAVR